MNESIKAQIGGTQRIPSKKYKISALIHNFEAADSQKQRDLEKHQRKKISYQERKRERITTDISPETMPARYGVKYLSDKRSQE